MTKLEKVLYTAKAHTGVAGRAEPPAPTMGHLRLTCRLPGHRHQPRAAFRRRLVSLFPQCDKARGRQKEGRSAT
jgi:hypothetical protein